MCEILSMAVNSDGRSATLSAPNGLAQEEMLAGVSPDFVEPGPRMKSREAKTCWKCHGTGTALGDPIEVGALSRVLKYASELHQELLRPRGGRGRGAAPETRVHGAEALGLARLASYQQCTQHLQVLNPHISTNLQFLTEVACTPKAFAFGVSAFGFGGTNAHVVLRPHRSPRPLGTRPTFQRRPFLWQAAPDVLAGKLYGVQWRRQAAQPTLPAEQTVKAFLPDLPVELPSGVVQGSSCGEDSTHLLFLRALGAENASAASEELFELLDLARDCSQQRLRVSLLVVTQLSALSGLPGEGRRCNSAALWGLARSLRLEAPWVSVRLLDLEGPSQLGNISLGELGEGELEFGHLDAHFRVPRLAALQPEGRTPRRQTRFGWHLISGGTGGIGLLAALALPAEGLILLSRRGEIAVQEHALFEELESSGVKLQRIRADVADAEAVAAVMQQVSPLQGIVHAAQAPLGYVELARQSRDTFLKEFRVRGLGAWNLHRAERGVQSFVAITSLNAALGQGSNSAIAAANCLVEGLVVVRRSSGQAGAVLQFSRVAEVGSNAKRPLRYASAVSAIRELPMQLCAAFLKSFLVPSPCFSQTSSGHSCRRSWAKICPSSGTWQARNKQPRPGQLRLSSRSLPRAPCWCWGPASAASRRRGGCSGWAWAARCSRKRRCSGAPGRGSGTVPRKCRSSGAPTTWVIRRSLALRSFPTTRAALRCSGTPRALWIDTGSATSESGGRSVAGAEGGFPISCTLERRSGRRRRRHLRCGDGLPGLLAHASPRAAAGGALLSGGLWLWRGRRRGREQRQARGHSGPRRFCGGARAHLRGGRRSGGSHLSQAQPGLAASGGVGGRELRAQSCPGPRARGLWSPISEDLDIDTVVRLSAPMYRLAGIKEEELDRRVMAQSNPAISDAYFLLQAMGVLEVVVGDVQRVLPAAVQVAEASGLRELPCQVLVKCLGWDHSPHKALDGVLQLQRLRGFWVDGDCRRFVFKFSSNSTGARSLSTLSFFVLLSSAMDAFFHFLTRPAELEEMLDNLPTATTLGEDLGATFVGRTLLALHGLSAPLCRAAAEAARRKSAGILEVHPAERFLEELAAEWRQYSAEAGQTYPYALTDVRQMLEERQRVARDEAKAPPSARSAGAMSLEALRTKILTAARRALGAENLVAETRRF
ncbi:unnamed protein product [Effrenium voratum]|nr:unnamed protein product [Effrenium voratum]